MNALIDVFPRAVEVDGEVYELNTDFRICLKIILAFEDPDLTNFEKQMVMLSLLYKEIPPDTSKAQTMALKFMNCGEGDKAGEAAAGSPERLYSFESDAKYIFSAIKQTHGVDLENVEYLHWWKFSYMFLDLKEDCFFTKIIYFRKQRSAGKLTKEEQEFCETIQDILDLPEVLTAEEQSAESEFMRRLLG